MQDENYRRQVLASPGDIDLAFWRNPEGVGIPDDDLRFLFVPDAVESAAVDEVAQQVHAHQAMTAGTREQITVALVVTMGGMLPGVLLHDHLVKGRRPGMPVMEFGTVGVSLYESPGVRHEHPRIQQEITIPVEDHTVLLVDDLGDVGGTLAFLHEHVANAGACKVLGLVLYLKPAARKRGGVDFHFGATPQDTWVITPRERVETLMKRVPLWKRRGASEAECRRRLIDIIGYPQSVVDHYLPGAFARQ